MSAIVNCYLVGRCDENNIVFIAFRKTQHLEELASTVTEYADAVNILTLNVSRILCPKLIHLIAIDFFEFLYQQRDCNDDMAGIMDKLRSLKHNISGATEPTQQIYNKFVIEELLKYGSTHL